MCAGLAPRLPRSGETWHLVEGVKDAAALHGLGLLACGVNTSHLSAKFARLFRDVHVVLVPDRDEIIFDSQRPVLLATANCGAMRGDALQKLMRHRSYSTTQRYINMAGKLEDAVRNIHIPEILKQAN